MNTLAWLQLIVLGGIVGAAGQTARMIVGLKKLNDEISAAPTVPGTAPQKLGDAIDVSRLVVSLLIGFVAGVLAAITLQTDFTGDKGIDPKSILALMAAGYAGTDFIEGIMNRYLPSRGGTSTAAVAPPATQFQG